MGVFDNGDIELITSSPEAGPEADNAEATRTEDGHVEGQVQDSKAPEAEDKQESQQEEPKAPATQDVKEDKSAEAKDGKPTEEKPAEKLLADRYKTLGGLINGIQDAAKFLGQQVDWTRINNVEEAEAYYKELRADIGRGKVTNFSPETAAQLQQQNNQLNQELDKLIASQQQILNQPVIEEAEEDPEVFADIFLENPQKALKEHDARLTAKLTEQFKAMMNVEAAKLVKSLGPVFNMAQEAQGRQEWNNIVNNVKGVIAKHGDNDFDQYESDIAKFMAENPDILDQKEKGLMFAYQQVKLNKQLAEFAKTRSEQDNKEIKDSKKGLKIQSGVGGGKLETKNTDQEWLDKYLPEEKSGGIFDH